MLRVPTSPIQFDLFGTGCQRGRIFIDHRLREREFLAFDLLREFLVLLVCLVLLCFVCACYSILSFMFVRYYVD